MKMKIVPQHHSPEATKFILLGLTSQQELQPILSVLFLLIYLITMLGTSG